MSPEPAAQRTKVSRSAAAMARAELEAGGLSHHDQRRLKTIIHNRELASSQRRQKLKHLSIAVLSAAAVMAVAGAGLGLGPAIEAARRNGTVGTFIVSTRPCIPSRVACAYTGTFDAASGRVVSNVAYVGNLPAGAGGGSRIPALYTGYEQAYPVHSSDTWILDLVFMLIIGSVAGFFVWILPVGLRQRGAKAVV
jgi:hypothetical protein